VGILLSDFKEVKPKIGWPKMGWQLNLKTGKLVCSDRITTESFPNDGNHEEISPPLKEGAWTI